ncbi:MAG: hypothetical protein M3281_03785 [Chloroflexota bacterium]|nr:hypothetical protein [Chloroflexota bacterium]
MPTLTVDQTSTETLPIDVVMEAFVYSALEMTPDQALERLQEPKDHMPREVAQYIDELMQWVLELHEESGQYHASHLHPRLSA